MNQVVKDVLSFDRSQCQFGSQPSNILGGEAWQSTELKISLSLCVVFMKIKWKIISLYFPFI